MIPFSRAGHAPRAAEYAAEALRSDHAAGDWPFTRRAATRLSGLLGGAPVLLTPSCTKALELAALLLDLGPGDEIVMPTFTFPSTANAFRLRGATIRSADVDPATLSMGLPELRGACTPRTRVAVSAPTVVSPVCLE